MKLISMTDFVLEQCKNMPTSGQIDTLFKIYNYANFLKQPLTLGMFVPCYDDGSVLEEPDYIEMLILGLDKNDYNQLAKIFELAQSKVLFKGKISVFF